jgi:hypothetical protein
MPNRNDLSDVLKTLFLFEPPSPRARARVERVFYRVGCHAQLPGSSPVGRVGWVVEKPQRVAALAYERREEVLVRKPQRLGQELEESNASRQNHVETLTLYPHPRLQRRFHVTMYACV